MQQCPALSPWGQSLQKGWGEGHREVKGLLGPNGSCSSKQRCPATFRGDPAKGRQDGWTDTLLAKAVQLDFLSLISFFFPFNFVLEATIL